MKCSSNRPKQKKYPMFCIIGNDGKFSEKGTTKLWNLWFQLHGCTKLRMFGKVGSGNTLSLSSLQSNMRICFISYDQFSIRIAISQSFAASLSRTHAWFCHDLFLVIYHAWNLTFEIKLADRATTDIMSCLLLKVGSVFWNTECNENLVKSGFSKAPLTCFH